MTVIKFLFFSLQGRTVLDSKLSIDMPSPESALGLTVTLTFELKTQSAHLHP